MSCHVSTPFPNEITYQVATEAILGRTLKRAQRLRLVSKTWKEWVDDIHIRLGHFVSDRYWPRYDFSFQRAPFWPRYIAHVALRSQPDGVSPPLWAIRQAAEWVVGHSDPPPADSDAAAAAVREHIIGICSLRELWLEDKDPIDIWGPFPGNEVPKPGEDRDFTRPDRSVLDFALGIASYKGYDTMVSLLLDIYSSEKEMTLGIVILYAGKGNSLSTLELVLGQECGTCTESPCEAMAHTSSLEIYQKLYAHAKARIQGSPDINYLDLLAEHMVQMARRGAVPILDYLILHREAARAGQLETLDWLLKRRYAEPFVLAEAVRGGNPAMVQLLLREDASAVNEIPLEEAVQREHEEMVRILLVEGRYILEQERQGATQCVRRRGWGWNRWWSCSVNAAPSVQHLLLEICRGK
ncbi:uncharacterized protein PG986_015140 [Apiospora aurea]|uniref:F-box domain-containing protein n=1 Tax=Apiospora aurea TaxID=335848 RepID=A0ABR1PRR3_9PEZI